MYLTICFLIATLFAPMLAAGKGGPASAQQQTAQSSAAQLSELAEAEQLNKTVITLYRQDKYDEALPLAKHVVELRERTLGSEHQLVANALANLGVLYIQKGDFAEAKQPLTRALKIYDQQFGIEYPAAVQTATNLALVFRAQRELNKSEELYRRVLTSQEKKLGQNSLDITPLLLSLGSVLQARGHAEEARVLYERAINLYEAEPKSLAESNMRLIENYSCLMLKVEEANEVLAFHQRIGALMGATPANLAVTKNFKVAGKTTSVKNVINGMAISKPMPSYPAAAKRERAQGSVAVAVTIDETGNVKSACAVSGHPLLQEASEQAALNWRFSPTKVNGNSIKVIGTIIFNYTLQ